MSAWTKSTSRRSSGAWRSSTRTRSPDRSSLCVRRVPKKPDPPVTSTVMLPPLEGRAVRDGPSNAAPHAFLESDARVVLELLAGLVHAAEDVAAELRGDVNLRVVKA